MIVVNDSCIDLIKSFEGFSATPYHGEADRADVFTIGYGTIQYPPYYLRGKRVSLSDPSITEAQAVDFLFYEVRKKSQIIDILLRDDLTGNQFAGIISFTYNCGEGALKGSTLRRRVNANPNDPSIREAFMMWVKGESGEPVGGLKRRRSAEADLYFKP